MLFGVMIPESHSVRFYDCGSPAEAARKFDEREDFEATMRIDWVSTKTAVLKGLRSDMPLDRPFVRHLAGILTRCGAKHALMERAPGHRVPFGKLIKRGPLAGMWHVMPGVVAAGADGDY